MRQKIGIDLDSTINNLAEVWLDRYNKDYNDNLTEWCCWNVVECVKPECGKDIFKYLTEPYFFLNLKIKPNAKEVISFLIKYFDVYVVTAYVPEACLDKTIWLKKRDPRT
jgi:5'(3')-deoxyribonucleotidase